MEKSESGSAIASLSLVHVLLIRLIKKGTITKGEAVEIIKASRLGIKAYFGDFSVDEDTFQSADQLLQIMELSF